jgi:hypothetical protein
VSCVNNPSRTLISVFNASIVSKVVFPGLFSSFWSNLEVLRPIGVRGQRRVNSSDSKGGFVLCD